MRFWQGGGRCSYVSRILGRIDQVGPPAVAVDGSVENVVAILKAVEA
jgi:hypothetical protein